MAPNSPMKATVTSQGQSWEVLSEAGVHGSGGTAILDAHGAVVSWNLEATRMTGYTVQEVRARGFVQLFAPPEVMRYVMHKARLGMPTLYEYLELIHHDSTRQFVTVQGVPQPSLNQSHGWIRVTFRPLAGITAELRQHEQKETLARLASALSHEMRNPLSSLTLHADILQEELSRLLPGDHPEITAPLMQIQTETQRMHALVEDYLSQTRLLHLQRQREDLRAILEELRCDVRDRLAMHQIVMHVQGVDTVPYVFCHKGTLRRALLNLTHNAIEAMSQGGTLTLRAWQDRAWVHLAISDTGAGIPEAVLPRLFMPFQTGKPHGTGLGLYVVQEIIAAHGGTIDVSTAPSQGTTFVVNLPLTMPEATS